MHTILDFCIRVSERGNYNVEVHERETDGVLAQGSFKYDLLTMTSDEISHLDAGGRDPVDSIGRLETIGRKLYDLLFMEEIQRLWQEYKQKGNFLECCLRFAPDAVALEALPWETLYDGKEYIAAGVNTGLSHLPLDIDVVKQVEPVTSPAKMLVFISNSLDSGNNECSQTEREQQILLQALNDPVVRGSLDLTFEDEARLAVLEDSLDDGFHLLHFSGHSIPPETGGGPLREDAQGEKQLTSVSEIISILQKVPRNLRLVVLSSLQTTRTEDTSGFRNLARALLQQQCPAVIAMQFPLSVGGRSSFAKNLYPSLLNGQAPAVAMSRFRRMMLSGEDPSMKADAFAPVLLASYPQPLQLQAVATAEPNGLSNMVFHGRRKQYRDIHNAFISQNHRAVIVHGSEGIGKTALAIHTAKRLQKHFKGTYAFECSGGTLAPEIILLQLHRYFSQQNITALQPFINRSFPPAQLASYASQILNHMPLLLIFDNFEAHLSYSEDRKIHEIADKHLREFLTTLIKATSTGSRFLFTSRYPFDLDSEKVGGVHSLSLDHLSRQEAIGLMQKLPHLGQVSYDEKLKALDAFGGHPHALVTLDRHCAHKPLAKALHQAAELHTVPREFLALELNNVNLSQSAQSLLNRLSVFREAVPSDAAEWVMGQKVDHPHELQDQIRQALLSDNPDMSDEEIQEQIELLPEQRFADGLDPLVEELIGWGMITPIEEDGQTRLLAIHSLVRDFCRSSQSPQTRRESLISAAAYYTNQIKLLLLEQNEFAAVPPALQAFELLMEAQDFMGAAKLLLNASELLIQSGLGRSMEPLTYRVLPKVSNEFEGSLVFNLGNIFQTRGDYDGALNHYGRSLQIRKELADNQGITACLHQIGMVLFNRGDYDAALAHYEKFLRDSEELGIRQGVAGSLLNIGIIHNRRGDYDAALDYFGRSLTIFEEMGNQGGISTSLQQIGMIHYSRGDYDAALDYYGRQLKIMEESGNRQGEAASLRTIGATHSRRGEHSEALDHYYRSLLIEEEIENRQGIAASLHQIGMIHFSTGNHDAALELYSTSLNIMEELGDRGGIANALHQIGIIHDKKEKYDLALDHYSRSLKIMEEMSDRHGVANSLHQIGNTYYNREDYEAAYDHYGRSLKIRQELGDRHGVAVSLGQLGLLLCRINRFREAFDTFLQALYIFSDLKSPETSTIIGDLNALRTAWGEHEFDREWKEKTGIDVPDEIRGPR